MGGLVSCPVIAVPTSVGYGAHFHGLASLLSMLNSCASNVSVVNIDNGFGGGWWRRCECFNDHGRQPLWRQLIWRDHPYPIVNVGQKISTQ